MKYLRTGRTHTTQLTQVKQAEVLVEAGVKQTSSVH